MHLGKSDNSPLTNLHQIMARFTQTHFLPYCHKIIAEKIQRKTFIEQSQYNSEHNALLCCIYICLKEYSTDIVQAAKDIQSPQSATTKGKHFPSI